MPSTGNPLPMNDINDIKPLEIPVINGSFWAYILGAICLLACVGTVIFFWRKRRNRKQTATAVAVLPHEAAMNLLNALAGGKILNGKAFYFSLSNILRTYIEARFGINALEMTSEELIPRIDAMVIPKEIQQELKDLLRSSDPVKFAGVPATDGKMRQDLECVRNMVMQTSQVIENAPGIESRS